MLNISMLVSFLVTDLDQQVDEGLGGNTPGPQDVNEPLQDQLLYNYHQANGTVSALRDMYLAQAHKACSPIPSEAAAVSAVMQSLHLRLFTEICHQNVTFTLTRKHGVRKQSMVSPSKP